MDSKVVPPMNHCEIVEVWNKSEEVTDDVQNSEDNANYEVSEASFKSADIFPRRFCSEGPI